MTDQLHRSRSTYDALRLHGAIGRFFAAPHAAHASLAKALRNRPHHLLTLSRYVAAMSDAGSAWQDRLLDLLEKPLLETWKDRPLVDKKRMLQDLLPRLLAPNQLRLLRILSSLGPRAHYWDDDAICRLLCRHCLYGIYYIHYRCQSRNREMIVDACRLLGPAWCCELQLPFDSFVSALACGLQTDEEMWSRGLVHLEDQYKSIRSYFAATPTDGSSLQTRRRIAQAVVGRKKLHPPDWLLR